MNIEPVWLIAALIVAFSGGIGAGVKIGFRMGREDAEIEASIAAASPDPAASAIIPQARSQMLREANALDRSRKAPKPTREPSDPMRWVKDNGQTTPPIKTRTNHGNLI